MQWDKSFELGCECVDDQHKELVSMVSQLEAKMEKGITNPELAEILRFLVKYTKYHFDTEERFMKNIGYPELESHRKKHDDLIEEVNNILLSIKTEKKIDVQGLYLFLVDWVKKHVLEEDKKIGEYYQKMVCTGEASKYPVCFSSQREMTIKHFKKLIELFKKKLITIEDFREQKFNYLVEQFSSVGPEHICNFCRELDFLVSADMLGAKEKENILIAILEKLDFPELLQQIEDTESRLFLLRKMQDYEINDEMVVEKERRKILETL